MMLTEKSEDISLSVVVASIYSASVLKKCLESILAGDCRNVEIIVAHNSANEPPDNLIGEYPQIRFLEYSENAALPVLWAAGIALANGEIVAVTDLSCLAAENWIAAIFEAHQSAAAVIGGAVEMSEDKSLVDWSAYFCEYGQFMLPVKPGAVQVLPGNNISFKREILEKHKQFVENEFWKTYLCQQLQSEGIELISAPSMLVYYDKSFKLLPFLVRRFHHGRCFAGMRVSRETSFRRAVFAAGTLFLPFVFLIRTIIPVWQKRRFWGKFLLSFPISVLAILFWSAGETCGYLAGTGKSCEHIY